MANKPKTPKGKFNFYWIYGIIAAVLIGSFLLSNDNASKKISKDEFITIAEKGYVKKVMIYIS